MRARLMPCLARKRAWRARLGSVFSLNHSGRCAQGRRSCTKLPTAQKRSGSPSLRRKRQSHLEDHLITRHLQADLHAVSETLHPWEKKLQHIGILEVFWFRFGMREVDEAGGRRSAVHDGGIKEREVLRRLGRMPLH